MKGRKDIYTPQKAKEPLHGDSLSEPYCPDWAQFILCTRLFHTPALMLLKLNAKAAKSRNYTCIVRLCQLLIAPRTPENLHTLAVLVREVRGKV